MVIEMMNEMSLAAAVLIVAGFILTAFVDHLDDVRKERYKCQITRYGTTMIAR